MVWHVAGAGAMGCLWGAKLAKSGQKVCLLLKGAGETSLKRSSLSRLSRGSAVIRIQDGRKEWRGGFAGEMRDTEAPGSLSIEVPTGSPTDASPIDRVLVAVKAYDAAVVVRQLRHRLGPNSVVVILCQQPALMEEITRDPVVSGLNFLFGTTIHGAYSTQRFHVVHSCGYGEHSTWFGLPRGRKDTLTRSELESVISSLAGGGLGATLDEDITPRLWERLGAASAINPLTALLQCHNGKVLESVYCKDIMQSVLVEAAQLMVKTGVTNNMKTSIDALQAATMTLLEHTPHHYSSMSRDVRLGRDTEIEYFNGFIADRAREAGFVAPVNETLRSLIRARADLGGGDHS